MFRSFVGALFALLLVTVHAHADIIDFNSESAGSKANGYTTDDSSIVHFSDTNGNGLVIVNTTAGTHGNGTRALNVDGDTDGSGLQMTFDELVDQLSLSFGNDQSAYSNAGDLAVLTLYLGVAQVGQVSVVLNRLPTNQVISHVGVAFDRATFFFTDPLGNPYTGGAPAPNIGLTERVDDIEFRVAMTGSGSSTVPEPASIAIWAIVAIFLGLGVRRRSGG